MKASCVMLTRNRRHLAPVAIECFRRQSWKDRELIVVDDGEDSIKDLVADIEGCRYIRTEPFTEVGRKLNFACEHVSGEVIVTWDDDDWYADGRIEDQVTRLIESDKVMTGYHTIYFYDGVRASQYRNPPLYCTGTSQVYRTGFWEKHLFPEVKKEYDNGFAAKVGDNRIAAHGHGMVVARIHDANLSGKRSSIGSEQWPYVPTSELPVEFFEAIR